MTRRTMATVALVVACLANAALPAFAHVGTVPQEVPAGQTSTVGFRIGHGCDGSPTVEISMQIPAGLTSVSLRAKPGWTIEVEEGTLPEPVVVNGETITDGAVRVTWTGGSLDTHQYDDFEIRARFPDTPGETIHFPVVQTCEEGEHGWIQVAEDGAPEPESPAPSVRVVAASTEDASGDSRVVAFVALTLAALGAGLSAAAFAASRKRE